MNRIFTLILFVAIFTAPVLAQQQEIPFNIDSTVTTQGQVSIKGKRIPYTATTGTQPVWDEDGKPIAGLYYTYYERTDIQDQSRRPIVISFNGGPGSASVWMHLAYTGPKILKIDDEGYPVQPYGVKDNPHSILDVADIVFVNPVNTGFSRAVSTLSDKEVADNFFGVNVDIEYLAGWVNTFITRQNRWASPKYLIGESYGTARVSGLSLELQDKHWMYLNGVILVSPTDLGITRSDEVASANILPYYTAAAWFHNKLAPELQQRDLTDLLPEVEEYAINELMPALAKGGFLDSQEKLEVARQIAEYAAISEEVVLQHNLRVPKNFFWKELLRDEGFTIGRLDSRYLGIDRAAAGGRPDYNAELTSWLHSFTPAMNLYIREHLNYKTDLTYNMFGSVWPWDSSNNNTGEDLREAMAMNPYLNVMVQAGYYDGATDYFNSKYNLWQMDPSGRLKDRMRWEGYRSGHMMYLRSEDLETANEDIREFIIESTPAEGQSAQYLRGTTTNGR